MWQDDYSDVGSSAFSKSGTWEEARAYCNASTLGGHTRWRLPTKYELIMLLEREGDTYGIDPIFQSKVHYQNWWSKSIYAGDTTRAWSVYFGIGGSDSNSRKGLDRCVRCVRGLASMHGECTREKEIVTDKRTNLQWQDNLYAAWGQEQWGDALQYCEDLSLSGIHDWRLPNINELHTLVDITRVSPALSHIFEHTVPQDYGDYWSSTTSSDSEKAYYIDFSEGSDFGSNKTTYLYTRCVRGPEKAVRFNPAIIMYLLN